MNEVILQGRLIQDAEYKETEKYKLSRIAISVSKKLSKPKEIDGEMREWQSTIFNITAWDYAAQLSGKLKKGDHIQVKGEIVIEEYEKDGQKRRATKINARRVDQLLKPAYKKTETVSSF